MFTANHVDDIRRMGRFLKERPKMQQTADIDCTRAACPLPDK
ncbi:hypothetical protein IWQ55_000438 [Labrenzia sp. EL_208]|nr:hypothetical protein [Labrenzia sp. EL_132]MBG6227246.1 hypothetical protein [Labrenzia sp. EL_208]